MSKKYLCPKCRYSLNVGNEIILIGKTRTGLKGLVVLSAELGNYTTKYSDDITVTEGNRLNLTCPVCNSKLSRWSFKNMARLILIDNGQPEQMIYFSQIIGENCTYVIEDNDLKESYGNSSNQFSLKRIIKNKKK